MMSDVIIVDIGDQGGKAGSTFVNLGAVARMWFSGVDGALVVHILYVSGEHEELPCNDNLRAVAAEMSRLALEAVESRKREDAVHAYNAMHWLRTGGESFYGDV